MDLRPAMVSDHLSYAEVACRDAIGTPYPLNWRDSRLPRLAAEFEAIRRLCGHLPIHVESVYRTPAYNEEIRGEPGSLHLQGLAMDLWSPQAWTAERFHALIRAYALSPAGAAVGGLGIYTWGCHVDLRPRGADGRLAEWDRRTALTGRAPSSEV